MDKDRGGWGVSTVGSTPIGKICLIQKKSPLLLTNDGMLLLLLWQRCWSAFGGVFFCPKGKKNLFFLLFLLFWFSVVTSVTFNSNLSCFDNNKKNPKKSENLKFKI